MIIAVASGKGGTGKTLVSTSLALSLKTPVHPVRDKMPGVSDGCLGQPISNGVQFIDCDVEEPNAAIFLKPEIKESKKVYLPKPIVEDSKCISCGKCSEICQYNAIAVVKSRVLP